MLCGQSLIPFHFITSDPLVQETVTDSSRNCRFFTRCTGQNFSNQLILFFCCQYFVLIFMSKCFWTTSIFCTNPNPNCIMKSFFIYSLWCFWPFSLAVQFHTLFLVFITIFHKNTPNTGCPVLGVHITFLVHEELLFPNYSHSMVPGGLEVISYTIRLMLRTSLTMRTEVLSKTS